MWSEFVVKPSETWRFDSPGACNLPRTAGTQQADRETCYQPSHLSCTAFPEGWKSRYFSICICLLVPLLAAVPGDFVLWITSCSGLLWKIPMQQKPNSSQPAPNSVLPNWAAFLIIPKSSHPWVFVTDGFLSRLPFDQPPPLPSDAFQTYLGKQGVVIRNAHVCLPGVTRSCSAALGILTMATTSIDRIWYLLNRLFVYLSGCESKLQPAVQHRQLNNARLPLVSSCVKRIITVFCKGNRYRKPAWGRSVEDVGWHAIIIRRSANMLVRCCLVDLMDPAESESCWSHLLNRWSKWPCSWRSVHRLSKQQMHEGGKKYIYNYWYPSRKQTSLQIEAQHWASQASNVRK